MRGSGCAGQQEGKVGQGVGAGVLGAWGQRGAWKPPGRLWEL